MEPNPAELNPVEPNLAEPRGTLWNPALEQEPRARAGLARRQARGADPAECEFPNVVFGLVKCARLNTLKVSTRSSSDRLPPSDVRLKIEKSVVNTRRPAHLADLVVAELELRGVGEAGRVEPLIDTLAACRCRAQVTSAQLPLPVLSSEAATLDVERIAALIHRDAVDRPALEQLLRDARPPPERLARPERQLVGASSPRDCAGCRSPCPIDGSRCGLERGCSRLDDVVFGPREGVGHQALQPVREALVELHLQRVVPGLAVAVALVDGRRCSARR